MRLRQREERSKARTARGDLTEENAGLDGIRRRDRGSFERIFAAHEANGDARPRAKTTSDVGELRAVLDGHAVDRRHAITRGESNLARDAAEHALHAELAIDLHAEERATRQHVLIHSEAMMSRFPTLHAWLGGDDLRREISERVRASGRVIVFWSEKELASRLAEVEVLWCGIAPKVDWARAEKLALVQVLGSGTDSFWPATGLPTRVLVANARGVHLPEMRDHALAMILAFERDLFRFGEDQRARVFQPHSVGSVHGKTVAILGAGTVGRAIGEACAALGMRVLSARESVPYDLHALLAEADYVVVTLPLTPKTRGLIDARALAAMKPSAVLVAMSRGGIVDETALAAANIRGAALDVFAEEPLPPSSPLWNAANVVLTPHVAGLTPNYIERLVTLALDNVALVERGESPRTLVDRTRGY
jgi:D-2-hydroxyacid dehydrogenase (NADP+)